MAANETREVPRVVQHVVPHFKNDLGVPAIRIGVKEFMCCGASTPFDHPHEYLDLGAEDDGVCPYCSTRFVYDASLGELGSDPPGCLFEFNEEHVAES